MRKVIIVFAIIGFLFCMFMAFRDNSAYGPTRFYNRSGEIFKQMKVYMDTFVCTTGNGMVIDISPAGFTKVAGVNVIAERSTATATSSPQTSIKSWTTSAVTVNITEGNATLVSVLGLSVLQGVSTQFVATPSTVILHVQVIGY